MLDDARLYPSSATSVSNVNSGCSFSMNCSFHLSPNRAMSAPSERVKISTPRWRANAGAVSASVRRATE